MRLPITLDLHLPNFTYPGVEPDALFDKLVEIATTAERSGFSSISAMDHLHQIPPVGPPENDMLDGSTILAGLAARTSSVTLGLLVGSVTYRNPAIAAKTTTTIDIISGGRAWHGLGAGWFEEEHVAYGFDFPPLRERFERLEEALRISRSMFTEAATTVAGTHFRAEGAFNHPKPIRGDIPILVGGSGERKTLRLVAQYADGCNLFGDPERAKHLIGVLEGHCEAVGRDPAEITKTGMGSVVIGSTHEAAQDKAAMLRDRGVPQSRLDASIVGDPGTIAERAQAMADVGIEGMTISLPDVDDLEAVQLAGQAIGPVFAGQPA
ncbi:MAG: LLM class F420-dependent oxidoreductase [Solirubrobacterales bacterium]|nr:LLM class F420-dependent oxidoreductase [Solirubrobacterales bacterium]